MPLNTKDSVELCLDFFKAAVPAPTNKNVMTQMGCHFEEVREMIQEIIPANGEAAYILNQAEMAVHQLAEMLKRHEDSISGVNRVGMLDAIADQMVTAIGSAYMMRMNILGGFIEVNQSNLSKFDKNGYPIFDKNQKVTKGPFYKKAELEQFV